jgi:hypothetical protein
LKDKLIVFLIILIIALSCLPLFKNIQNINLNWDWLQMLSFYKVDRRALLQDHQFPLWTPYFGGGYPLAAHPQDGSLNPFILPVLILGEAVGLKINVFLFHLIGALGMYYLTRRVLNYNLLGAAFSSIVFCLAGHSHRLLIRGQDYITGFIYFFIPLTLALFIKSREDKRYLLGSVLLMTLLATQSGLYLVPLLLFFFLFSLLESARWENKNFSWHPALLRNFFLILGLSFLLGAVKTFPMLELLRENSREMSSYNPFWGPLGLNIYKAFFVRPLSLPFPGMHWNYFYIGFIPVLLALISVPLFWKKNTRWFILLVVFALLSFSARTSLDLFKFLWKLPLFHSIEAPTRYFVGYVTFLLVLISGSFFLVQEKRRKKGVPVVLALLLIFTTLDIYLTNSTREDSFPVTLPKYDLQKEFFSIKNSAPGKKVSPLIAAKMLGIRSWEWTLPSAYELMLQNIGKINAYVNIHLRENASPKYTIDWDGVESLEPGHFTSHLNPDYKGEVYFLGSDSNNVRFKRFASNRIVAEAVVKEPGTLVINQNFHGAWRSSSFKIKDHQGLLAMDVDKKGEYLISLTYLPWSFYGGFAVSLLTLTAGLLYLRKSKVRG